jgi:Zn-dependent metalloprotease
MPVLTPASATADIPAPRIKLLGRLAATSAVPVSVSVAEPGGPVTDLRGQFPLPGKGKLETKVSRFLVKAGPSLGLKTGMDALVHSSSQDLAGQGTRVSYSQRTSTGMPIFGAGVVVDLDTAGAIVAVTSRPSKAKAIRRRPTMTQKKAAVKIARRVGTRATVASPPELVVVDPKIVFGESAPAYLGWVSSVPGESGPVQVIVPDGGGDAIVVGPSSGGVGVDPVPQYHLNDATGTPDFITFAPFGLMLPEVATGSATAVALALFTRNPQFFGTGDVPNQLRIATVTSDTGPNPMTHVRLQQMYAGVPVYGAELVVHVTSTLSIMSVSGNYLRNPAIAMDVLVGQDAARHTAVLHIAAAQLASTSASGGVLRKPKPFRPTLDRLDTLFTLPLTPAGHRDLEVIGDRKADVVDAGLEILPGVLAGRPVGGNHLTWRFRFTEGDILVSARTGDVVLAIPNLHGARQVFDALGAAPISLSLPSLILVDGHNVAPTPAGNADIAPADAEAAGAVGFWALLGRNGWNGSGGNTDAVTNGSFPFPNAMWVIVRNQMWFAPGLVRPDVVAHEFTHGVTASTSGLFYLDESGALNEHYSDVMGNLAAPDSTPTEWFVGETGPAGAGSFRDMVNPGVGHYSNYQRPTGACATVEAPLTTPVCDAGGVHTNSGIGNRAAVLLSDGDGTPTHPGIGRSRLGRLFADTLTTRLHPWSRYLDELHNTWEAARDLSRRGVIPAALPSTTGSQPAFSGAFVQNEVVWAFNQVGVDRRLMTGWFQVGGGLFGGSGTTTFNQGQTLPATALVSDVELVVRAIEPLSGVAYWEGRSLVSAGGAVTFQGGVFGASVIESHLGTADETVVVRWFHSGFLPLEITVNILTTAVLPTQIESVSSSQVHWGTFGGKGDDIVNPGVNVTGTGCQITDVILELLDRNYQLQSSHRMGQADAQYGGTGARITSQNLGTTDATVGVHWWFDMGSACRYQLRYLVSGIGCAL